VQKTLKTSKVFLYRKSPKSSLLSWNNNFTI